MRASMTYACISAPGTNGRATPRCQLTRVCPLIRASPARRHRTCMSCCRPARGGRAATGLCVQAAEAARLWLARGVTKGPGMSIFGDPFDSERELRAGCICGRHRSAAQHRHAGRALRCEPLPGGLQSEERRYESVVASALMRAVFPKDATRRAFLRSVGVSTALAALSQFFPLKRASEVFAEGAAPEKKRLKVGFIPISCATPIIM